MFSRLKQNRGWFLAISGTAAVCLMAFGTVLTKSSSAFTQVERQFAFNPVEITVDQAAHVVFNYTFGIQPVHVTVRWNEAITGASIGTPFQADVMPGHGMLTVLPAVQAPPSTNGACWSVPVVALVSLSPAPGAAALPGLLPQQFGASLDVVDNVTQHVTQSQGFTGSLLPAVQ